MIRLSDILKEAKSNFDKYEKYKDKVIIPTGISASENDLDKFKMGKFTVGVGIKLQSKIRFPYKKFDLMILKDEIVILLTREGQFNINVNMKKDPNYLKKVIDAFKSAIKEYLAATTK